MLERRGEVAWLVLGIVQLLGGCGDTPMEPSAGPPSAPDARPYVDGAALSDLDAAGHFQFLGPPPTSPHPFIGPELARDIALGVIRTWYANPDAATLPGMIGLVATAEGQHGAPIDWDGLRPTERLPFFAESHLEPLPASAGNPMIRAFGPHFLVSLYSGDVPAVVVGVSAHATNVSVNSEGLIERSDFLDEGGEFRVTGIPRALAGVPVPPSPEAAVQFAFLQTGLKTVEVPVLGVPGNRIERNSARWRLVLERPVEFERLADGGRVTSPEIFVAVYPIGVDILLDPSWVPPPVGLRLLVPAGDQPSSEDLGSVVAAVRPGYAVNLYEATAVP